MNQTLMNNVSDDVNLSQTLQSENKTIIIIEEKSPIQTNMADIGRPYSFRPDIDQSGVAKEFLHRKMGVVEIIPCNWNFPINLHEAKSLYDIMGAEVTYEKAINTFQRDCKNYGVSGNYSGVRIFLMNQVSSEDTISHTYNQNMLDSSLDSIRQSGLMQIPRLLNRINRSTQISTTEEVSKLKENVNKTLQIKENSPSTLISLASSMSDILLIGQKISFPKIWKDSNYTPGFNVNARLFSPFGHPKAIKKFIIEPLVYLILLCGSATQDGMSYGYPRFLTVKGYGSINLPLSFCTSISWKRGGDDNNFSIYKQPTVIDVTIGFEALIGGFGYYSVDNIPDYEPTVETTLYNLNSSEVETTKVTFMTLGNIINSLKPYLFEK